MDTGLRWVSPRDSATITRSVALSESYFFRLSVQSTQSRNQSRSVPRCPSRPASREGSRHPAGRSLSTSAGRTPCQLLSRFFLENNFSIPGIDICYYCLPVWGWFTHGDAVTLPVSLSVGMSTIMTSPAPTLPRLRPNQTYFVLIVSR